MSVLHVNSYNDFPYESAKKTKMYHLHFDEKSK